MAIIEANDIVARNDFQEARSKNIGASLVDDYDLDGNRGLREDKHVGDSRGGNQLENAQRKRRRENASMGEDRSMEITEKETHGRERQFRKNKLITCMGMMREE